MKAKTAVFLVFLALGGPVIFFLFLKTFGKNEYEVLPLHSVAPIHAPEGCSFTYSAPYRVADSVLVGLDVNRNDSLFVVYFDRRDAAAIDRVRTEFRDAPVDFVTPDDITERFDPDRLRECIFLMKGDTSVALLDHQQRVRGNYYGADRDEIDRLVVEMKIILKQY